MSRFIELVMDASFSLTGQSFSRAQVVGVLPCGEPVVVFTGSQADAMRYLNYLGQCARWLRGGQSESVPTFSREHGQYEVVSCPEAFDDRVRFAASRIREQDDRHRAVDACFEQGDGGQVVYALVKMAQNDPFLRRGIEALGEGVWDRWKETAKKGGGLPMLALITS